MPRNIVRAPRRRRKSLDAGQEMTLLCILAESLLGSPSRLERTIISRFQDPGMIRVAWYLLGKPVGTLTGPEREEATLIEEWVKNNMKRSLPRVPGIRRLLDVFILNALVQHQGLSTRKAKTLIARAIHPRTARIAKLILGQRVPGATARDRKDAANCRTWADYRRKRKEAEAVLRYDDQFDWN